MVSVRLEKVTKRFGKVVAVNNVDLEIEEGEFMALLGPSGSGKSTLLYLIAGIYKPTSGKIYFGDRDVTHLPPRERNVGLVFQNYALYPHMKVFDNIAFPLKIKKVSKEEIKRKVLEVAKLLRIEHLLDRYPGQLSGGQQQRVAIARALVKEPQVLLLDEPLSNLDALLRVSVRSELKRLQKSLGITAIYVTHDQAEAMALADRIAIINEGVIQQVDLPEVVYNRPRNMFVGGFIGNPPMNFIEARVDYGETIRLIVGGDVVWIPEEYVEILRKLRLKKVVLGFRPEDVFVFKEEEKVEPGGSVIRGEIFTVEPMGREVLLTVVIEEAMVKVYAPPTQYYSMGDKVFLQINPAKLRLFDPDSTIALEYMVKT